MTWIGNKSKILNHKQLSGLPYLLQVIPGITSKSIYSLITISDVNSLLNPQYPHGYYLHKSKIPLWLLINFITSLFHYAFFSLKIEFTSDRIWP